ncbi:MAG TPA: metallophosphoesterase [Pyrinomonadaceae bacterium]|nr:metallophosphoesterase [Pyrinomonadaceae bacterium]
MRRLAGCLALWALVAAPAAGAVRFAVIGDYGRAGAGELAVSQLVKSFQPDLVITTGDNNYPNGCADTIDANIGQYYHEYIYNYAGGYGEGSAALRFLPSLGNHDYGCSPQPYLDYFTLPGNERYYDHQVGNVHFFAVDSNPQGGGTSTTSEQALWLKAGLAASTATWKIVYFHHPPYSSGAHGSTTYMRWPFKSWGATAVIAGHDHTYERLHVEALPFFVNGLGGNTRYNFVSVLPQSYMRFNANFGAMIVEAHANVLRFEFWDVNRNLVDAYARFGLAPPINLSADRVTSSGLRLVWGDTSAAEKGFRIELSTDGTNFVKRADTARDADRAVVSGLSPKTTYYLRVRAFGQAGVSSPSNTVKVMTL